MLVKSGDVWNYKGRVVRRCVNKTYCIDGVEGIYFRTQQAVVDFIDARLST